MNLRTLRAFVEVVRQGGFSQAATVVFATQSTVSKAVKSLEEEMGGPLLNRIGHRAELTPAGEVVYRRAQAILSEREDMVAELSELRGLKRGVLRLGLPPIGSDTLFAPLFATFRSRYPGIDIRLVEHGSSRLQELLVAGEVELAGLLAPLAGDFETQEVRVEPLVALLPGDHRLGRRRKLRLDSLAEIPFILFEEGFALNPIILGACEHRGFTPTITARSGQITFIVELVAAGLGVAFLPRSIAELHRHPAVRRVPLDEPRAKWHLVLAWRRDSYLSQPARAWLELTAKAHKVR
ncbi:MAG: LysR family transcriptional regulator [Nevskiales bacterium]